jgi:integrase
MNIYKRGKIWWGSWTVNGKRERISSGTEVEAQARAYLTKKQAESFQLRRLSEKPRRTWSEATERYLAEHSSLRTIDAYRGQSEWWTNQLETKKVNYLDEITPDIVAAIRDKEYARPKERGGGRRSPADINRKLAYLRAVFNAAYREYRWFGVGEEPPLFRQLKGERQRQRYLEPHEVLRLAEHLPNPINSMAIFAAATGLRQANVLYLRWDQVNVTKRTIILPSEIMKNGQPHSIPINDVAMAILRERLGKSADWVFTNATGQPIRGISSKVWAKAVAKAGLEGLRWHDLRHTWASIARQRGLPPELIQELGGWKDPRMVQRYSHLSTDHLQEAANEIGQAFGYRFGTVQTHGTTNLALTG